MYLKKVFDLSLALFLLLLLSPLFFFICIILLINNKGSIFFLQNRPGKDEKIFRLIKFKTMQDIKDSQGSLLADKKRLTKFGTFLRSTSLDELPEIINILKGDMSFVGPRPLLEEYLPLYTLEESKRHNVKPGLTGWAQINGRNNLDWKEKFTLDLWYVKNKSFILDLKILFITIKKVITREGISASGEATMSKFRGTNIK